MRKWLNCILLLFLYGVPRAQDVGLCWKVTGNNLLSPSYLFGTMHTNDVRVIDNASFAMPLLRKSATYAMELDPQEMPGISLISKLQMGEGYSLKKMVPPDVYTSLDSLMKGSGVPLALMDNMAPIVTLTMVQLFGLDVKTDTTPGAPDALDMHFYNLAQKQSKTIVGLESVEEQINALNALTYEEQALMLTEQVRAMVSAPPADIDLLQYYLKGQLDSLSSLDELNQMPPKLYQALVTDRNRRMAVRISRLIREHSTFVAVGALHLPGEFGLIRLLRKEGFTVEPILADKH